MRNYILTTEEARVLYNCMVGHPIDHNDQLEADPFYWPASLRPVFDDLLARELLRISARNGAFGDDYETTQAGVNMLLLHQGFQTQQAIRKAAKPY